MDKELRVTWERRTARRLGATGQRGSWARNIAVHLGAEEVQGSWARQSVKTLGLVDAVPDHGSWTYRMRRLDEQGRLGEGQGQQISAAQHLIANRLSHSHVKKSE